MDETTRESSPPRWDLYFPDESWDSSVFQKNVLDFIKEWIRFLSDNEQGPLRDCFERLVSSLRQAALTLDYRILQDTLSSEGLNKLGLFLQEDAERCLQALSLAAHEVVSNSLSNSLELASRISVRLSNFSPVTPFVPFL